jgi:hypothetical protein
MTVNCPSYETYEEATAHLHEYAQQYADKKEDESLYEVFLNAHLPMEIFQGKWVVALRPGHMPFTFSD